MPDREHERVGKRKTKKRTERNERAEKKNVGKREKEGTKRGLIIKKSARKMTNNGSGWNINMRNKTTRRRCRENGRKKREKLNEEGKKNLGGIMIQFSRQGGNRNATTHLEWRMRKRLLPPVKRQRVASTSLQSCLHAAVFVSWKATQLLHTKASDAYL